MPEYLAPGVFVEETSFRQKTIEGVGTSTAGFVGATRFGPATGLPELLTGFGDFERIFGGIDPLMIGTDQLPNYLAYGVRSFFENGGRRCYVSRVVGEGAAASTATVTEDTSTLTLTARHPGRAGDFQVTLTLRLGPNIFDGTGDVSVLRGATEYDVVWINDDDSGSDRLVFLHDAFDTTNGVWSYEYRDDTGVPLGGAATPLFVDSSAATDVRRLTVDVEIGPLGRGMDANSWQGLSLHHEATNSIQQVFDEASEADRSTTLFVPLVVTGVQNGPELATVLMAASGVVIDPSATDPTVSESLTIAGKKGVTTRRLTGGVDGSALPDVEAYTGREALSGEKSGLMALEDLYDISIVATPGSTQNYGDDNAILNTDATVGALITHCERMRYRIAVIDPPPAQLPSQVREFRGKFDSKYAALYYPWITVYDSASKRELELPPSGHVAGIYARNDVQRGVHKAPANETIATAVGFQLSVNTAQQEALNPLGINCLRTLDGRGRRVWGARTMTSDPEWKYVNLRRYFAFLEASIDRGTQWAVFEPNGERLWANVRRTVEDFLFNEFASNHLLGGTPEEAFFVRCDRTTMTQNDLDNGRLVCLIGVSPLRPAEFVVFRIGQMTLDSVR